MRGLSIALRNVWFRYSGQGAWLLKKANALFDQSSINVVRGEIGSGKTTLLYLIVGLLEPEKGEIEFNGTEVTKVDRSKFGFAFQNPDDQMLCIYVKDEIGFTAKQVYRDKYISKVEEIAESIGVKNLLDRRTRELSFGQKKLVTIASALVHDPKVILLDEPFAFLSKTYREKILDVLLEEFEMGKLVVLTSHDDIEISNVPVREFKIINGELLEAKTVDKTHVRFL